ncbi:calcium/calmodulin-dependent protein kinase type 1G, putative [Entamoeba invadens IP1]|uniref:calcium/calmodulin-dependent protein kinase type 1G, putative n=1 Tax=Entamoeba invadens IP1 TaxID=370355 RepID=UPI0002C3D94D|nr:calcium/calmodulin-dependent protein kinase type 1G, putative [Entamoeba invadens IP1]ELP85284.1 calcium/calmodulin-dependent protein kinase type 1G, putative [Entamoeba invadens IP1]|eukprot:XP_004184630.1 calcium/calmodulin-dependent protein kinase type 1G, putative [Entamoeba invadens IP1]
MEGTAWGILQNTVGNKPSIPLYDRTCMLGRGNPAMNITTLTISSQHFMIQAKEDEKKGEKKYSLTDTSTNGTYLNQTVVGKNGRVEIQLYDEISLLSPIKEKESASYMFLVFDKLKEEEENGGPQKKYNFGRLIGKGSFARVREVTDKATNKKYAMKIIDRNNTSVVSDEKQIFNEFEILRKMSHKNVIGLYDVFLTPSTLYIVFELVDGGDLFHLLEQKGCLNEMECRLVMQQLLQGLQYLHHNHVIHRDIKPENLLLTKTNVVKISDFGLSKSINHTVAKTCCGTPMYVSPEVLSGKAYDEKTDVWSAGVVFYTLVCGFQPFTTTEKDTGNRELFDRIENGHYKFPSPYWDNISTEIKNCIQLMLTVNPMKRPTVRECLLFPFFSGKKRERGDFYQPSPKRYYTD